MECHKTGSKGYFKLNKRLSKYHKLYLKTFLEPSHLKQYSVNDDRTPSMYCEWIFDPHGKRLAWNTAAANYETYIDWLKYIMDNFLIPWNYTLNGNTKYQKGYKIVDVFINDNNIETSEYWITSGSTSEDFDDYFGEYSLDDSYDDTNYDSDDESEDTSEDNSDSFFN